MIDMRQLDDWLAAADYTADTRSQYTRYLTLLFFWIHQRGIELADLRPAQLVEFLDEHPGWGPTVRHNVTYSLRAFLRAQGQADHPIMLMKARRPEAGPQRTLNMDDVANLLQACAPGRPKDVRNAAVICLLLDSGLRASELCRLSLSGTDLDQLRLSVLGKGRRWRRCVFSEVTAQRIRAWLPVRQLFASADTDALFVSVGGLTPGQAMTRYGWTLAWTDLAKRAGLAALSSHDFRRTFAVLSAQNRMPLNVLMSQGGWSSTEVAGRYLLALSLENARVFLPTADLPL